MKILITGSTGFIGLNLVKYLVSQKKYKVFALARQHSDVAGLKEVAGRAEIIKFFPHFKSISTVIGKIKPKVVVHLAAFSPLDHTPEQIEELITSNILFPTLLVEAMVKNGVSRLVNTGSFWEYLKGNQEYLPLNLYAATKKAFEDILRYYADAHNFYSVTLKLYGTYGPGDPRPKLFSYFKKSLDSQEPILFSPGEQRLDLVYIEDVVRAYEKAVWYVAHKKDTSPEVFFIGTGKAVKLRAIARVFAECVGGNLNITWGGRPYRCREVMSSEANIEQAKRKLRWSPKYDLKKGIRKMLHIEQGGTM